MALIITTCVLFEGDFSVLKVDSDKKQTVRRAHCALLNDGRPNEGNINVAKLKDGCHKVVSRVRAGRTRSASRDLTNASCVCFSLRQHNEL